MSLTDRQKIKDQFGLVLKIMHHRRYWNNAQIATLRAWEMGTYHIRAQCHRAAIKAQQVVKHSKSMLARIRLPPKLPCHK